MSELDWLVTGLTLSFIVFYGMWKSRNAQNIQGYLLADKQLPWYQVGFSVMATQASAITFLSAPGQGFSDGLRFVQFYFGLPLAMIVLCVTFIPIFHRLNVYTAYEYLEKRFDTKTRSLTAFLFLLQRGLSTGITIYAPAIVLSTILNIDLFTTIIINGILVITYTVYGGTKAVSYTQMLQMSIIFGGLIIATFIIIDLLKINVSFGEALQIAGKMDRLNAIDTTFDVDNKYNLWSGLIGGFFLQLSYFGTDQSQVGRYLTGSSIQQSRMGLLMNALIKIPMQFFILFIGVLVFVFYQFNTPPIFFNQYEINEIKKSNYATEFVSIEEQYKAANEAKGKDVINLVSALKTEDQVQINKAQSALQNAEKQCLDIKKKGTDLMLKNNEKADTNDTNFVFLIFVTKYLPHGVVGLLIAIIFLASMGSTASGLNSLASTTVIDFYKRHQKTEKNDRHYLTVSRISTLLWGVFCIIVALFAQKLGNLIEAVNILGSLFYGTILGIFLVAFYLKKVGSVAVFWAAVFTECFVIYAWINELSAFLWLNLIGTLLLMVLAFIIQLIINQNNKQNEKKLI
jgi:SSS family transporter